MSTTLSIRPIMINSVAAVLNPIVAMNWELILFRLNISVGVDASVDALELIWNSL